MVEDAFIADAILDYHWWNRLSFGLGAGFWSGNDGQMDLIANLGVLVFGKPDSFNGTLFLEARSAVDELDSLHDQGRFGLGMRFGLLASGNACLSFWNDVCNNSQKAVDKASEIARNVKGVNP